MKWTIDRGVESVNSLHLPLTGGKAWGRIASLIETCKINGVEPFAYLKATLEAIAVGHPKNRIDDLLPLNFTTSS